MMTLTLPKGPAMAALVAGALLLTGCFGGDDADPVDPTGGDGGTGDGSTGGNGGTGNGGNGNPGAPGGNGTGDNSTVDPRMETFPFAGTANAGAEVPGVVSIVQPNTASPFTVEQGASGILVELQWDQTINDLDLQLESPDCADGTCSVDQWNRDGSIGSGDSPAVLRFEPPAGVGNLPGEWVATVWAKAAAVANYNGVVTVFYGQPIPADYTGL